MTTYGIAICKKPISLDIWGCYDPVAIELGEILQITYHEFDGTLGLTKDGVELICSRNEREHFEEEWDKT